MAYPSALAAVSRRILGGMLLALTAAPAAASPLEAWFAPRARLWARWTPHDPGSTATVDHGAWDRLLKRRVRPWPDGTHRVPYAEMGREERRALHDYLVSLAAVPVGRLRRAEQFAYWVNLYNALTMKVVLDAYPVASIRDIDISPGLLADGPWGAKLVVVEGEALSLDDIEHRILRPIWRDPRVHYAINCAAIGCPDLMREAFTAATAGHLLDAGAHAFINHPRGVSPAPAGLVVSSIYNWFAEDFRGEAGVVAHLLRHAAPPLAETIRRSPILAEFRYDWRLNDAR